jgi:hypothetical protein
VGVEILEGGFAAPQEIELVLAGAHGPDDSPEADLLSEAGDVTADCALPRVGEMACEEFEAFLLLVQLDVVIEVAAGHAEVRHLVACEGIELFESGLHVMLGDLLALADAAEVHAAVVHDLLVVLEGPAGDSVEAEVLLGLHDGEPELPFELDLGDDRPEVADVVVGAAADETGADVVDRAVVFNGFIHDSGPFKRVWAPDGPSR